MAIRIVNRSLDIPISERNIGHTGDNLVEVRIFELNRYYGNIDLSEFDFKLDTQVGDIKNIIDLDKAISGDKIVLTWLIKEAHLLAPGRMDIQIRAFKDSEEKWHSAQDYVNIQSSINASAAIPDPLPSEFVQMEQRVTAAKNAAEEAAQTATEQAGIVQQIVERAEIDVLPVLNQSIEDAGQAKDLLDGSIEAAGTANTQLSGTISAAGTAKIGLEGTITQANTVKGQLDGSITQAGTKKTELDGSITAAGQIKEQLDESIVTGDLAAFRAEFESHKNDYATYLASELGEEHIIRTLPNGIEDVIKDGKVIKLSELKELPTSGWVSYLPGNPINTIGFYLPNPFTNWMPTDESGNCSLSIGGIRFTSKLKDPLYTDDEEGFTIRDNNRIYIRILRSRLITEDVAGFHDFLSNNQPALIAYQLATPIEIPLPDPMTPNTKEIVRMLERNDCGEQPKLSMQYAISKVLPRNTASGGNQFTFSCFYQVYDTQFRTSGAIYAVEQAHTGFTEVKVFRSFDGGDSWDILGSIPCDYNAGEDINAIFVEPYDERIIVQKVMNRNAATKDYRIIVYDASLVVNCTLNIANKRIHAASHSIDSCLSKDGTKRIIMFAEYGDSSVANLRVMRSIDKGITWNAVFEKTGDNGISGAGEIRHFHTIQVDPYTSDWYLGSGDNDNQCTIWRSQDDGLTWDVLFSGTQNERTLGFVFEEDYFYYAMDSASDVYPNKIYKINKTTLERTVVAETQPKKPVYALTKTFFPKGFLVFSVHEWGYSDNTDDLIIHFYDTERNKLYDVAKVSLRGVSTTSNAGIEEASRCQCKFTGSIFLKMTHNLAIAKYGMGVTKYVSTPIMKAKLTM